MPKEPVIQSLNGKSYHVDLCQEMLTETGERELIVEKFMTPIGEGNLGCIRMLRILNKTNVEGKML